MTLHELPDEADQQRQQMIQNTQIKNPKMAVLNVDVVWTAEFAANSYVEALPPDLFPTEGMLKPTVDSATYFDKLYAYPSTIQRWLAVLPQGSAGQVQPASADVRSTR